MVPRLVGAAGVAAGIDARLEQSEFRIGRHSDNDLVLGDLSISRHHCVISFENGEYGITDNDSNNGTFVNGQLVCGRRLLANGARISIGDAVLCYVETASAHLPPPPPEQDDWVREPTIVLSREEAERIHAEALRAAASSLDRPSGELRALLAIGNLLGSVGSLDDLQRELIALITNAIDADSAALLLDGGDPAAPYEVSYVWSRSSREPQISRSIYRRVWTEHTPVLYVSQPGSDPAAALSLLMNPGSSVLCVPLLVGSQLRGAIYLETSDPRHTFTEAHLRLLTAIAGYVALALDNAQRIEALELANSRLRLQTQPRHAMVGESAAIKLVHERIGRIGSTDATVLIEGESGTGKELAARALHMNSARANGNFEAINCALLRDVLLESELFGHEKGAFTGAVTQKRGKLEMADGGTVFLDEIGELSQAPQAMLLRVLQQREFTRLGGLRNIQVNVRVIAATNRDLEAAIKDKTFRDDLYYRLNVICLRLPPLRDRREDIPLLATHFLQRAAQRNKKPTTAISRAALAVLSKYPWPGNVRELENAIEHAVVMGITDEILPEDLPENLFLGTAETAEWMGGYHQAVRKAREQIVLSALEKASHNYGRAATLLGIHVNNLHRLIRELGLKDRAGSPRAGA